jgi:NADH-ubiquinone oxidoreductase chain 6
MYVTSITWDGSLAESSHISSIGNIIYTNYFILLIITCLILLLSMIGTICLVIN